MTRRRTARGVKETEVLEEARTLSGEFDKLSQAVARRVGLSTVELLAIDLVSRGVEMTPGLLAQELHLTTGAVTGLLDRLERDGFAERSRHPTDRRRLIVRATAKEVALRKLYGPLDASLRQAMTGYSDRELATLAGFLRKLSAAVSAAAAGLVA